MGWVYSFGILVIRIIIGYKGGDVVFLLRYRNYKICVLDVVII